MWIIEPEFCSRKCVAQARLMANEPCRCTMMTSDQSDQLMRWKILSRRMPALFTRMSTRPKVAGVVARAVKRHADVVDDDLGAFLRQHKRDGAADAAAGAGDDGDLVLDDPG